MDPRARPAPNRTPCPSCGARSGRERGRAFKLTMDTGQETRAYISIRYGCPSCGHRWTVEVRRDWELERGVAAPHPGAMRDRQERYARKLYRSVFDYPAGAFRSDPEAFAALEREFRRRMVERFPRTVLLSLIDQYVARAASKLLARWEPPVSFLYKCRARRKNPRAAAPCPDGA